MCNIRLSRKAKGDIAQLRKEDPKYAAKLWDIILDIIRSPHSGIGKPEALKDDLQGWWSRQITDKHRIIYKVEDDGLLLIASCWGHYGDR